MALLKPHGDAKKQATLTKGKNDKAKEKKHKTIYYLPPAPLASAASEGASVQMTFASGATLWYTIDKEHFLCTFPKADSTPVSKGP